MQEYLKDNMDINFVVKELTALKYFLPIVIEAKKRNLKSNFFIGTYNKYNCPIKNFSFLKKIAKELSINLLDLKSLEKAAGVIFFVEKAGIENMKPSFDKDLKKISLTYMTDFSLSYDSYINKVDHVVMPSKFFAEKYNKLSDKNLYLGSPKYDIVLDREEIKKKYNLSNQKKALIIFPRIRDLNKIDMSKIYNIVEEEGYEMLVKTRGKDPVPARLRRGRYFEDDSWFPHTTMELIEISDFVVNFGSTSIKECVLMKTPIINFDIKPFPLVLDELYNFDYCEKFSSDVDSEKLKNSIRNLTKSNLDSCFNLAIQKYLFDPKDTSSRILDRVL